MTQSMFHWCDGWFFGRRADGSVRVLKVANTGDPPNAEGAYPEAAVDLTIPGNEWASIVAMVSLGGEIGQRHRDAERLHNTPAHICEYKSLGYGFNECSICGEIFLMGTGV